MVPATPKREVRTAPKGAATPPAAILAGSTMCCLCWSSKTTPSEISCVLYKRPYPPACIATHCNTIYRVTGMLMPTRRYLLLRADFYRATLRTMGILRLAVSKTTEPVEKVVVGPIVSNTTKQGCQPLKQDQKRTPRSFQHAGPFLIHDKRVRVRATSYRFYPFSQAISNRRQR